MSHRRILSANIFGLLTVVLLTVGQSAVLAGPEQPPVSSVSTDTLVEYRAFLKARDELLIELGDGYESTSIVQGTNIFALSSFAADSLRDRKAARGAISLDQTPLHVDALSDLEGGRGIDPESFAALYADRAKAGIAEQLELRSDGVMLFDGKVIQMTPVSRLQRILDDRFESQQRPRGEAYVKFFRAADKLEQSLIAESLMTAVVQGTNFFAISVGGVDAVLDLEEGQGVDPETFATIYAGRASGKILPFLDQDSAGRWRYKGTIIRMYSRERLREVFQRRDQMEIRARRLDN